ncbi:hypothetical protein JZ751_029204 [Albula glossodonta]|uniref:Uncharacterized protein n=1 Tax=Albula glossodonta TaxID=121402 RepID=A0A8T2PJ32_9TELE|nr:hypothetical protein JZ751_029204 [Albula glossodonta]
MCGCDSMPHVPWPPCCAYPLFVISSKHPTPPLLLHPLWKVPWSQLAAPRVSHSHSVSDPVPSFAQLHLHAQDPQPHPEPRVGHTGAWAQGQAEETPPMVRTGMQDSPLNLAHYAHCGA